MQPQELGRLIEATMARHCNGDAIIYVDTIVEEILAKVPPDDYVNPLDVRQRVMSRGISHTGMRW